jgi:hypothetical protein
MPKSDKKTASKQLTQKLSKQAAEGIVDTIQTLAMLIGHNPDPGERHAAVLGLQAAARKSPFMAKLLSGGLLAGDTAIIVLGLGGMFARIGTDVLAKSDPKMLGLRNNVHMGTSLAYNLIVPGATVQESASSLMDLAQMFNQGEQSAQGVENETLENVG